MGYPSAVPHTDFHADTIQTACDKQCSSKILVDTVLVVASSVYTYTSITLIYTFDTQGVVNCDLRDGHSVISTVHFVAQPGKYSRV